MLGRESLRCRVRGAGEPTGNLGEVGKVENHPVEAHLRGRLVGFRVFGLAFGVQGSDEGDWWETRECRRECPDIHLLDLLARFM